MNFRKKAAHFLAIAAAAIKMDNNFWDLYQHVHVPPEGGRVEEEYLKFGWRGVEEEESLGSEVHACVATLFTQ